MYQILLYYKYTTIANPDELKNEQRLLCEKFNLKGRIIVASEGINGTVEGTIADTEAYISAMKKDNRFSDIVYKKSPGTGSAFPKLQIRVRPEIVTTNIPNLDPTKVTGKYLTSEELYKWFEEKKEFYIVDMRNSYEYASGHFENFIPSEMRNFFELKQVAQKLSHLKNKTIVTVCTGGVRCEKASGFLITNGFKDVYQLKDGIQTFMEKYPNKYFKGKLYVFDNRITIGFNVDSPEHEIVGRCLHCNVSVDSYVNCEYDECHFHYISCSQCKDVETNFYFCKKECKDAWKIQQKERAAKKPKQQFRINPI